MPRQDFWRATRLSVSLMGLVATLALHACASANPLAAANDLNQRAYAVYGSFVIAEEQGAKIEIDSAVPANIKQGIRIADAKAKPAADVLVKALQDYQAAAIALKAGASTQDKLNTAADNLTLWLNEAQRDVTALVNAVKAKPGVTP